MFRKREKLNVDFPNLKEAIAFERFYLTNLKSCFDLNCMILCVGICPLVWVKIKFVRNLLAMLIFWIIT